MPSANGNQRGEAGASASMKAEAIRRRRERERSERSTAQGMVRALLGPSATEKRLTREERQWSTGAQGERMLAEQLAARCPGVALLHDLQPPGRRLNIDHVAIAATGVYVIDAKRYRGSIRVHTPLFGKQKLLIDGRDRTKLVDGLDEQVEIVQSALAAGGRPDVPVSGCLCFVAPRGSLGDVALPLFETPRIAGHPLYRAGRLCKQLNRPGPLTDDQREALLDLLARSMARPRRARRTRAPI